ncbi:MAG: hypothetical protein DWQ01_22275 [Planctomycetota bacterium]|nr:MAG: hypothetical protein DWQ01_22275 [Planctomycetota bacterium]
MIVRNSLLSLLLLSGAAGSSHWLLHGEVNSAPVDLKGAQKFAIDPGHTAVLWKINHLGFSDTYGRFNEVDGSFVLDADKPENSSVNLSIKAASIDSNSEGRDKHLRSPDFLNVKQFPTISFESTNVARKGELWQVSGDLKLHGKSKNITVDVKQHKLAQDPWGKTRTGFETVFSIDRTEFGITHYSGGIGDQVEITIALEGVLQ